MTRGCRPWTLAIAGDAGDFPVAEPASQWNNKPEAQQIT
jgi:hypothetical protein